ncbi:EAL domain-containing protein [Clostridium algoriphilum]|uniref:EAL domain-containing protein n=1 Tax=Clostridium algoriphilum TaxID=198347 RepID=UPI001CF401FD|nr:EAL domain-containing protein [Clostridium algoriphilum]MCB2295825.1 EAL domain-containing protein [Clostridium algoriphilum]
MLLEGNIQTILFTILCICFIFYLFLGIYSYKKDKKSKVNVVFFALCICTSFWAIGYAFMLISPNIKVANLWRLVSSLGWCSFSAIWIFFTFSLNNEKLKNDFNKIKFSLYISSIIFFVSNLMYQPSKVLIKKFYGWVSYVPTSIMGTAFIMYCLVTSIAGLKIIFSWGKNSKKNRIKKQNKIILMTSSISFCLAVTIDMILPKSGIMIFPLAIITNLIAMGGMWYAINKHKMMSISYELVSEYLFEAVNEPIFILGEDFLVKNCNGAVLNVTGYNYKELKENSLDSIINFRDFNINTIIQAGNTISIEVDLYRENKEALVCELSATVIYDEYKDILGIITLLHDVSVLVNYDTLTGLTNRKKLLKNISDLLENTKENLAFLFIALDKFKAINDSFGHETGDVVLTKVAERLKSNIRSADIVSRIGGDEFIVIIRDLKSSSSATEIGKTLVKVLSDAFIYNNNLLYIGASVGISLFPEHGTDVDTLIRNADLAMYEIKNSGGYGCTLYNNIMNDNNIHKLETEKNLKNALNKKEFITYYQPIIDLKSMKVLSAESLIRWKREERIIQPIEFISIAKKMGRMVEIDNWMLYNACSQCKKWQKLGAKDFSISVNTSYKQLIQLNFVQLVMNILHGQSLDPRYLSLEITEDEAMEDIDLIIKVLLELKLQGVKISMDDFGTGYSSLSYLSKLPINTIKIDRSLIINLDNNSKNLVIIKSILAVATNLNIKVIAEGIETEKEFATLKELRCDYIQGYLIGKPMPASDFQHTFIK